MKYGRYGWPYLFLCWGLGLTFLWIGVDTLRHTGAWVNYVPENVPGGWPRETILQVIGFFDVAIGLALVVRVWPKLMGGLATVYLLAVIIAHGIDAVLIRNVGLLGMALALSFWPTHYHRKRGWRSRLFWRGKKSVEE